MITSTKNYIKTKKKIKEKHRQNVRMNGKSKCIQTESHKEAYTYTVTKNEKGKNIHIFAPKVHCLNFGMIFCLLSCSTDAGCIKLIVDI